MRVVNKDRIEAERIEKEKRDAEAKAEAERIEAQRIENEKLKAEAEKLAKAPVKKQLKQWVDSFKLPETLVDNATSKEIISKFEAFKKWSETQINSL